MKMLVGIGYCVVYVDRYCFCYLFYLENEGEVFNKRVFISDFL